MAREAGVSTATAGRALGCRPNRLARGLVTGATQTVGVMAGDVSDPFRASVLRSVSDLARRAGLGVIVTSSDEDAAIEASALELFPEQVDGLILSPVDLGGAVQIDRVAAKVPADSVAVDNLGGAPLCVERLLPGGADLAAFPGRGAPPDPLTLHPSWQRLGGDLEAHRAAGVPVEPRLIRPVGLCPAEAARAQVPDLLRASSRGAREATGSLGPAVPADLSLIRFDDLDRTRFRGPGIPAAGQPVRRMGEAAAGMMLDRIRGEVGPPRRLVLPVAVTDRGPVRAPPTRSARGAGLGAGRRGPRGARAPPRRCGPRP